MKRLLLLLLLSAILLPVGKASTQAPAADPAQLAPLPPALPRTHTPEPTQADITAADLKTRLYIFADDSMQGREAGTVGNVKGTDYIAAEVKKMGLQPAGDNGTYFQTVPTTTYQLVPGSTMKVDGAPLTLWQDYAPYVGKDVNGTLDVVYGGQLGAASTLTAEQTAGKLVVYSPQPNWKQQGIAFPQGINAAVVALTPFDSLSSRTRWRIQTYAEVRVTGAERGDAQASGGCMFLSTGAIEKLFGKPLAQLTPGDKGKSVALEYAYRDQPSPNPVRNVVAILPGSDPAMSHTYVAIGAHNDHLGFAPATDRDSIRVYNHIALTSGADSPPREPTPTEWQAINAQIAVLRAQHPPQADSIYNGADDDGSGSVSVLEIAQYLSSLKVKPKRSILFVWHTGEEKGLWGSIWFTGHPTVPIDSIVTQLNIDMVGRGGAADIIGGGPDYLELVGSRRLSKELGDLVEDVNTTNKHHFKFDYTFDAENHPAQIYYRSDHYSYASHGIPVTFFTTGLHPDYHQITDEPEYIDYDHMAHVDALIADVAIRVGNMDHRPRIDHP